MDKEEKLLRLIDIWFSSKYFYCEDIDSELMDRLSDLIIERIYGSHEEFERLLIEATN